MSFEISDMTRVEATRCPYDFACLEVGEEQVCRAERYLEGNGLFIRRREGRVGCPYVIPFGYSHLCTCPVHVELYQRYGI